MVLFGPALAAGPGFYEAWSDGMGEVNVYDLVEERYGELRNGNAVLVYVSEEIDRRSHVKVESGQTPPEDRIFVVKLNKLLRFSTGIYDYSVMTSVFSVPERHLGHHPFQAARIVNTTQEWCGQVLQRADHREDDARGSAASSSWDLQLRSYFESEADHDDSISADGTDAEDNLWIWIRELDGPVLRVGESLPLKLLPSLWSLRKTHRPPALVSATIRKVETVRLLTPAGEFDAVKWQWDAGARSVTAWVEDEGARRLLGWEDKTGGHARLVSSERLPYWTVHDNDDLHWRRTLRLPSSSVTAP
jgi:hypothetical protein